MPIAPRNQILKALFLLAFLGLLAAYLAVPVNLTAVDIGRHIKNGELLLSGHTDVLYKNFYSFTYPQYPFINHHWLAGVLFYLAHHAAGFEGLAIFYIFLLMAAFLLFFDAARRNSGFAPAMFFSVAAFILLVDRKEIRPEGFSIFFMGLYFYLLGRFRQGMISSRALFWAIALVQLLWVNIHVFFIMGPLLITVFLWQSKAAGESPQRLRILRWLLATAVLVNLINPSGLWGLLVPLNIFKGFGYPLAENQTVFFMIKRFPQEVVYKYYLAVAAMTAIGVVLALRRDGWRRHGPMIALTVFVIAAGLKAVRLMMPAGFLFIPLAAYFYAPYASRTYAAGVIRGMFMIFTAAGIMACAAFIPKHAGIGVMPGVNRSAEFFKFSGLKGPVFSNYDIGGYLIYHLEGVEKVFVDNRQEAFPPEFFKNTYIPMEQDAGIWRQAQAKYGFNAIYFYRHDLTPWGQQFMIERIRDPNWAPVFVDGYTIIFARRGSVNQGVIDRFQLPQAMFRVVPNH